MVVQSKTPVFGVYIALMLSLALLGGNVIFATYVVAIQAHFVLCYLWSVRARKLAVPQFSLLAGLLLVVYFSPLPTGYIASFASIVFGFHFWRDELEMLQMKSWKQVRWSVIVSGFFLLGLILKLLEIVKSDSALGRLLSDLPLTAVYMMLVIYHVVSWYPHIVYKYKKQDPSRYKVFLVSAVTVNILILFLYVGLNKNSFMFKSFFGLRETFLWALLHMLFTSIYRSKKQQQALLSF